MQGPATIVLALTGRYEQLLNYVVFADWIFFGLTVFTVLVFRRRVPVATRPPGSFLTPGYPVLPVMFSLVAVAVVLSVIYADPQSSLRGFLLLALGVPIYYWYASRRSDSRVTDPMPNPD